jgi:hypothetical protein
MLENKNKKGEKATRFFPCPIGHRFIQKLRNARLFMRISG